MEILEIYLLNLILTVAMFMVLIFRAWIEFKNFKILWKEVEWRRTYRTARQILESERETFERIEGGKELYDILCHLFQVDE
ncbi:MAG: hypothetical protein RMJ07_05740 [Nitrososphaerota archaeon]|nr:hypothetical protein [Candidatus Bathyarchaeota archaeon]MDW8049161.1 hypothetical protein [Nitrososphaerota archaeon]